MSGTGRQEGWQYFLTLTAPGDRRHRNSAGEICPCTPAGGVDLAKWNAGHSGRWNWFRTVMRREYPGLEFMRGIEDQKRGALHDHVMLWSPRPLSDRAVRELALRVGFGCQLDLVHCPPGSKRAAYYVAKYVTKATDARKRVPWWGQLVDCRTGEVTEGLIDARYRTWSCSRSWGLTMAAVKRDCQEFARAKAAELAAALEQDAIDQVVNVLDAVVIGETPPLTT